MKSRLCFFSGLIAFAAVKVTFAAVGETTTNDALADEYPEPTIEDVDEPMEYCFYHELLNVPAMHAKGITGKGVRVGVVDDGIYPVIIGDKTNLTFAALAGATSSTKYHGTSVCSLIGSKKFGLAPDCEIWAYNSGDDQGQTGLNRTLTGIWWCATNGCRVINMSFGFAPDKYTDEQRIAFDTELAEIQRQTGVILINGNGNNPLNDLNYFPQDSECVIAIGGLKPDKTPAALTDSWRKDFCTFGDQVPDFISPDGTVGMFDGTSCACPLATALAALLLQQEPTLTQDEIYGIFKASVEVLAPGRTREYGWGLLQACEVPANYKRQIEYDAEKAAWVKLQSVSITNKFVTYTSSDNFYEITMRTGSVIRLMLSDPMPANATDKTVYWYCGNNHAGKPILTDQILRAPDEIATVTEITINGQTIKLSTPNLENVYLYQGLNANYEPLFNLRVRLTTDPVEIPENEDPNYVPPVVSQDLTAQLEYVAYPAFVRYQGNNMNASSIIDLQVYHDLIFSGYGNWDGNQGPVTMVPLEPNLKTLTDEGELGTDSTETLRVFEDGNLYVPATDRRESHANRGLFFRRNASGEWHTHTSIVVDNDVSTHFWDMMDFNGRIFLAGYGLASSSDGGTTWSRVESNPQNTRYLGFIKCGDELFCRDQSFIAFDYRTGKLVTGITNYNSYYWHWNKSTSLFDKINNNDYTEINGGVDRSSWALSNADLTNYSTTSGHPWHCTPFKDRSLYILGSASAITVGGKKCAPSGTFPAVLITAWAEGGMLKGKGVDLEGAYPYDLTVFGDAIYALTFKYKSGSQTVEHAVWKSTDGETFTKILFFDFQQVMASIEYHNGYFYFGVAHLGAQPLLGTLAAQTDLSGRIYRVWCPQEPLRVVASVSAIEVNEGSSKTVGIALSSAPTGTVTVTVARTDGNANFSASPATLTFTPSNWNDQQNITISLADTATGDASLAAVTCGVATPDSVRGDFASTEITPACVTLTPVVNDFAPTVASVTVQNRLVPASVSAALDSFGAENGVAKNSATLVVTAYSDAGKTQVVATKSASVTALGESVSVSFPELEPGRLYYFDITAKTTDALATVVSRDFTSPIATREEDLVDLTDDVTKRESVTGNSNVRPYDSSGAWDNTTSVTFGGYKRPNYSVYEFTEPTVANGFGLLGIAGQQESRMPLNYSFAGSNDTNGEWTVLFAVTNAPVWGAEGEWRRHLCDNTTAYKFYKVSLDENRVKGAGDAHVYSAEAELYFIGEPETPPEEPEEPVGLNNLGAPEGDRFELPLQQTWPAADYGAEVCLWRYDRYAALSFGHDDNCDWDIPFLLRESERNGFKLTWWLITTNIGDTGSTSGSGNWPEWRECFAAGHAIESHSHTHEWAGGGRTVPDAAAAAGMSVEDYVEFCMYSNSLAVIREKIPGCKPSTLAFPGGESYPEIANRYFVSGRSVGPYINRANAINYQSVNASSSGIDPGYINAMLGGRGGSKALAGWKSAFNDSKNYRGWFVPFLHTESTHDGLPNAGHEQGVAEQIQRFELLGRHRRHLWLGTYPAIAKYGQSRDTATLTVVKKTASEITFTLVDQMRDDWYDESLTVKVRLPAAWSMSGVAATQGGNALDAFYIERGGAKYALVNAVPDRGTVTLVPAAANSGTWDETSYETPTYTYQVRFYDTDGTTLLKTIIAHPIGTSAAELAPVIYKPGYKLTWTTADGVSIDDITDDVDFTAAWTATDEKPKAVFVDENGATLTTVETTYGARPAQPMDLPAREGYIAYWEPDLCPIVSNTQYRVKYMRDDDPIPGAIIVRTAEEFCDAMANHPDAVIRMVRDIDISGYGYTAAPEFSGTFKAYGHILAGLGDTSLCVTNSGAFVGLKVLGDSDAEHPVLASGYGVFAVVSDAGVFTDCRVDGYAIRANAQNLAYGVFVGTALKGTAFTNCTVGATCSIDQGSKPNNEIGGFVGLFSVTGPFGTLVTFAHCTNEAPIFATGDYNTAHGDGGFIGRASGCGAASTPEMLFVDCAELGLVSSSGGKSNLGGYIGYVPGLKANSTCKVIFEGCTTTMPVGANANAVGEWIGSGANVLVEHKEYVPPEPPVNPPVEPDDPPVEPEKPTEFVTNDWFNVEFEDDGYKAGSDWTKTSTDKSGGTWSGDDGGATTLDGTTFVVTLTDAFEGELRYTPSKASDADADVVVEGTMEVSAAAREIRPEDVPFALTFENHSSGSLTPVAYIGGAWHSFGSTGFAAGAWVDWKVEIDQTSTNAPRMQVTVAKDGGSVETSGWIAGGFAAKQVSELSYIGVGSFGDFKARYLTVKGGEVIELVPPEFAADGSALGFRPGIGGARMFALKITNPVKGAYYTVLTSTKVEGPYLPEGDSVLFDQDSGTLTLEVSADTPQKFAKILVSVSPVD